MTVVSETGKFLEALITLGLGKTAEALHQMTARLPKITAEIDPHSSSLLANDAKTAMKNGCVLAHIGIIEQWVKALRIQREPRSENRRNRWLCFTREKHDKGNRRIRLAPDAARR